MVHAALKRKLVFFAAVALLLALAVQQAGAATTREEALDAIARAERDIAEMSAAGLPTLAAEDQLAVSRTSLAEGRFDDVLLRTQAIAERKRQALALSDRLRAFELSLDEGRGFVPLEKAGLLFDEARDAFAREHYSEAGTLLSQAAEAMEREQAERTAVDAALASGRVFLEENWRELLAGAAASLLIARLAWRWKARNALAGRIRSLKAERLGLVRLARHNQTDYFKRQNLPKAVYDMRLAQYRKRLNEIESTLPVLERRLSGRRGPGGSPALSTRTSEHRQA